MPNKAQREYYAKLKDPRWQRLRLEVMGAANFRCGYCDSAEKTLNVHHRFYLKGHDPWEYEPNELICLCEDCHEYQGDLDQQSREIWGLLGRGRQEEVFGRMLAILAQDNDWEYIGLQRFASWETGAGICDQWGINAWRKYPEYAMKERVEVAELNIALWEEPQRAERGMIALAEGHGR